MAHIPFPLPKKVPENQVDIIKIHLLTVDGVENEQFTLVASKMPHWFFNLLMNDKGSQWSDIRDYNGLTDQISKIMTISKLPPPQLNSEYTYNIIKEKNYINV